MPLLLNSLLRLAGKSLLNKYVLGAVAIAAAFLIGHHAGVSSQRTAYQAASNKAQSAPLKAAVAAYQERDKINDESQDRIKKLTADNADLNGVIDGLRSGIRADQARAKAALAAGRNREASAALLYSNLLAKSVQRNQQLAGYADQLRESLQTCNDEYNKAP